MADKKAKGMTSHDRYAARTEGRTPQTNYPETFESSFTGAPTAGVVNPEYGAMQGTPRGLIGYNAEPAATTPINANPAAMRGYTRNAPYMEELVSDPQKMMGEIYSLQMRLNQNPDDVVSEYRLRILKQAIHDIYNMQPASRDTGGLTSRAIGQTTPGPTDYYNYNPTTPIGRR